MSLPSKGRFYKNFTGATVVPLTFEEEERILNTKGKGANIINSLIGTCVRGVPMGDLLPMDKLYLLMKIREVSYGSVYEFPLPCPACGVDIKTELDLSTHFNITEVPDDLEDPREINLPKLGVKAKVRFPRATDNVYLEESEPVMANLYRFVVSINEISDPVIIAKAIKKMHIQDVKALIKGVNMDGYGIDPRFQFECPSCDEKTLMAIPLGADFFSVS